MKIVIKRIVSLLLLCVSVPFLLAGVRAEDEVDKFKELGDVVGQVEDHTVGVYLMSGKGSCPVGLKQALYFNKVKAIRIDGCWYEWEKLLHISFVDRDSFVYPKYVFIKDGS